MLHSSSDLAATDDDVNNLHPAKSSDDLMYKRIWQKQFGPLVYVWFAEMLGPIEFSNLASEEKHLRMICFDKSEKRNCSLGWHQDRTIAVQSKGEVPGFDVDNKSRNDSTIEPPFELIEKSITVRISVDCRQMLTTVHLKSSQKVFKLGKLTDDAVLELACDQHSEWLKRERCLISYF